MKRIAILATAIVLVLPGSALAASDSTCQAYNPQTCFVSHESAASTSGTLPFTGMDIVLLAAGGGTLLCGGLIFRRLSRRPK
jgi:hypothetical protein